LNDDVIDKALCVLCNDGPKVTSIGDSAFGPIQNEEHDDLEFKAASVLIVKRSALFVANPKDGFPAIRFSMTSSSIMRRSRLMAPVHECEFFDPTVLMEM
jgi:hypothetical protein